MQNLGFTDLPIEIQSHILFNLSTPPVISPNEPSICTMYSGEWNDETFPDDMLHTAQTSVALSEAMLYTLGSSAKALSFHRSRRLPEWISILRKHVQVVSFAGSTKLEYCDNDCEELLCQCDNLHRGILDTLKKLYTHNVSLVAMNLEELQMTDTNRAEEIAANLIPAIQSSSSSLREIAIHANRASVMAISRVTLPNLKVAQIAADAYSGHGNVPISDVPNSAKTLGDILTGLNGHADRNRNICSIEELRLMHMKQAPIINRERCFSLFLAVEKLTIMCEPHSKLREIAKFIGNFRNLRTLDLVTVFACAEDMDIIFEGCPHLENLELCIYDKQILPGEVDVAQNSSRLNDLFVSFRGKLRVLETDACLTFAQIENLAVNCPNLEMLEMEIDSRNIGALCSLIGTHCRKLNKLLLNYSDDADDCLGENGWPVLAQAICSASDELHTITLVGDRTGPIIEKATFEMEEAIIDILEFMGDRASSIVFRVPINIDNPFVVLHALWKTLKVAKAQCGMIENLCLDFIRDSSHGGYQVNRCDEGILKGFFGSILDIEKDFNSNNEYEVDLGNIDALLDNQ